MHNNSVNFQIVKSRAQKTWPHAVKFGVQYSEPKPFEIRMEFNGSELGGYGLQYGSQIPMSSKLTKSDLVNMNNILAQTPSWKRDQEFGCCCMQSTKLWDERMKELGPALQNCN
jgi:hypothetical protein